MGIVEICLKLRWLVVSALPRIWRRSAGSLFQSLKQEITPAEDRGVIQIRLTAQQGSNLDYMSKLTQKVERRPGEPTSRPAK